MKRSWRQCFTCAWLLVLLCCPAGAQTSPATWANEATAQKVESILGMHLSGSKSSRSGTNEAKSRRPRSAADRRNSRQMPSHLESWLGIIMVAVAGLIAAAAVASVYLQRKQARLTPRESEILPIPDLLREARQHLESGKLMAALRCAHRAAGQQIAERKDLQYDTTTDGKLSAALKPPRPGTGFGKLSHLFNRALYGRHTPDYPSIDEAIQIAEEFGVVADVESESPGQGA